MVQPCHGLLSYALHIPGTTAARSTTKYHVFGGALVFKDYMVSCVTACVTRWVKYRQKKTAIIKNGTLKMVSAETAVVTAPPIPNC